jgi:hypothetical protein
MFQLSHTAQYAAVPLLRLTALAVYLFGVFVKAQLTTGFGNSVTQKTLQENEWRGKIIKKFLERK